MIREIRRLEFQILPVNIRFEHNYGHQDGGRNFAELPRTMAQCCPDKWLITWCSTIQVWEWAWQGRQVQGHRFDSTGDNNQSPCPRRSEPLSDVWSLTPDCWGTWFQMYCVWLPTAICQYLAAGCHGLRDRKTWVTIVTYVIPQHRTLC